MADQSPEKRPWESPTIVDVGDIAELTEAMTTNVNDNQRMTPTTWHGGRKPDTDEVELDGR